MAGNPSSLPAPAPASAPNPKRIKQRKERSMAVTYADVSIMKQVQETHAPDGREIVVSPIIQPIEGILNHAIDQDIDGKREQAETLPLAESDVFQTLAFVIRRISCELLYKCSGGENAHATMVLLNTLSSYPWHAKVVLTLAAFAVNFGKFWLVAQQSSTNTLAKSVAILEQLPDLAESSLSLKQQFDALNLLVKAALDVTKSIVEFKALPSHYISEDTPPMSVASGYIPIAAYWTIRSIVALSSQISLIGLRNEYISSTTESWELLGLAHKVSSIHEYLKNQLDICYKYIDDKKYIENYETLKAGLQRIYIDNQKILSKLFCSATDPHPLVDPNKTRVGVEALRRKQVLLLISDLDISPEEIIVLGNLYMDAKAGSEMQYEMVWIPVVDRLTWNDTNQEKFGYLQSIMPWYRVHHPLSIDRSLIKYIREDWHFSKKPIVVALDPHGGVCSTNAFHMIWIWGNFAFPITREKEEALWKAEIWSLELIVDGIDPTVLEWMKEGKHICLYGGEDIEWIRTFTRTTASVARAANITLEMVHVGKSNAKERMQKMISTFAKEQFSYYCPNVTSIWFFWARLERMLYPMLQHNKTLENDHIMSELKTVLTYDGSDKGWAIFCRGATEVARANGTTALKGLNEFDNWKENVERDGFVPAFREYFEQIHNPQHCKQEKGMPNNPSVNREFKSTSIRENNGGITSLDDVSEITGVLNNVGAQAPGQFNQSTLKGCQIILEGRSRQRRKRRSHSQPPPKEPKYNE